MEKSYPTSSLKDNLLKNKAGLVSYVFSLIVIVYMIMTSSGVKVLPLFFAMGHIALVMLLKQGLVGEAYNAEKANYLNRYLPVTRKYTVFYLLHAICAVAYIYLAITQTLNFEQGLAVFGLSLLFTLLISVTLVKTSAQHNHIISVKPSIQLILKTILLTTLSVVVLANFATGITYQYFLAFIFSHFIVWFFHHSWLRA